MFKRYHLEYTPKKDLCLELRGGRTVFTVDRFDAGVRTVEEFDDLAAALAAYEKPEVAE